MSLLIEKKSLSILAHAKQQLKNQLRRSIRVSWIDEGSEAFLREWILERCGYWQLEEIIAFLSDIIDGLRRETNSALCDAEKRDHLVSKEICNEKDGVSSLQSYKKETYSHPWLNSMATLHKTIILFLLSMNITELAEESTHFDNQPERKTTDARSTPKR